MMLVPEDSIRRSFFSKLANCSEDDVLESASLKMKGLPFMNFKLPARLS